MDCLDKEMKVPGIYTGLGELILHEVLKVTR